MGNNESGLSGKGSSGKLEGNLKKIHLERSKNLPNDELMKLVKEYSKIYPDDSQFEDEEINVPEPGLLKRNEEDFKKGDEMSQFVIKDCFSSSFIQLYCPNHLVKYMVGEKWNLKTHLCDKSMYSSHQYRDMVHNPKHTEDFLFFSHCGHGINSYYLCYYYFNNLLNFGVFLQHSFGGVYQDPEVARNRFNTAMEDLRVLEKVLFVYRSLDTKRKKWRLVILDDEHSSRSNVEWINLEDGTCEITAIQNPLKTSLGYILSELVKTNQNMSNDNLSEELIDHYCELMEERKKEKVRLLIVEAPVTYKSKRKEVELSDLTVNGLQQLVSKKYRKKMDQIRNITTFTNEGDQAIRKDVSVEKNLVPGTEVNVRFYNSKKKTPCLELLTSIRIGRTSLCSLERLDDDQILCASMGWQNRSKIAVLNFSKLEDENSVFLESEIEHNYEGNCHLLRMNDRCFLSGNEDKNIHIWDKNTTSSSFKETRKFEGHKYGVKGLLDDTTSPNHFFSCGGRREGEVCRWDLEKGQIVRYVDTKLVPRIMKWCEGDSLLLTVEHDGLSNGDRSNKGGVVKLYDFRKSDPCVVEDGYDGPSLDTLMFHPVRGVRYGMVAGFFNNVIRFYDYDGLLKTKKLVEICGPNEEIMQGGYYNGYSSFLSVPSIRPEFDPLFVACSFNGSTKRDGFFNIYQNEKIVYRMRKKVGSRGDLLMIEEKKPGEVIFVANVHSRVGVYRLFL